MLPHRQKCCHIGRSVRKKRPEVTLCLAALLQTCRRGSHARPVGDGGGFVVLRFAPLHVSHCGATFASQVTVGELPEADSLARLAYLIFVKHNSDYVDTHTV